VTDWITVGQNSVEWFEARLGKATASRFADCLGVTKTGKESAARKNYRSQLVIERMTGRVAESYTNGAMQWGTDTEPTARIAYSLHTGNTVETVGFMEHPELKAGASPDGLIDNGTGGIEIKCPNTATHIETLLSQKVPNQYKWQIYGQMWICNLKYVDFVSYDPRVPDNLQLFVQRVERDEKAIEMLEAGVRTFLQEVDEELAKLQTLNA